MAKPTQAASLAEKIYITILLIIFGGIVLHAPLTVGLETLWPQYELGFKAWKEVLMAVALLMVGGMLIRRRQVHLLKDPLLVLIAAYAGLHLALIPSSGGNFESISAGLMIDLRYLLYFVLVYLAIKLRPSYARAFLKVGLAGAVVVIIFAVLQVFVLPPDILKYIGYNNDTIVPYLTVDQNHDFIRINSSLRGPNPLGAYAVIVITLITAKLAAAKKLRLAWQPALLLVGSLVALWASYSRSAWGAAVVSVAIVGAMTLTRSTGGRKLAAIGAAIVMVASLGLFLARDTSFVSNIILHENPGESNNINSNEDHLISLQESSEKVAGAPLGHGIGSTGSASLLTDSGLIIENQYLYIAHEVGWVGLILFLAISGYLAMRLWAVRRSWLGLGVLASGIGLAIIGAVLPVWADDTVAIIWWGLAALAVTKSTPTPERRDGKQVN